jgi:hypothetical protein
LSGLIVEGELSGRLELSPEQKAAYPGHVREALGRARELAVPTNLEDYCNHETTHDGMDMHRDYVHVMSGGLVPSMCYEPWTSLAILPDGSVGPCCAFGDPRALSIKNRSLAEVWHGAYMSQVREGMLTGNPPDYCKRCPSNLYLEKELKRESFSFSLSQQLELGSRSLPGRLWYLAGKTLATFRESGFRGSVERGKRWVRIRRGIKVPARVRVG